MYKYVTQINLEFNFTKANAKLAERYLNLTDIDPANVRMTDSDLIKRDYGFNIQSYHWDIHQDYAQIVVTSQQPLTKQQLADLINYTHGQISDGVGGDFSAQTFADVRNNQSANPTVDFSNQFGPYADYDMISIENKSDLIFHPQK